MSAASFTSTYRVLARRSNWTESSWWTNTTAEIRATCVDDYVVARDGAYYVAYLTSGDTLELDLGVHAETYVVDWYNPRIGGTLQKGTIGAVDGSGQVDLGTPREQGGDWVVLYEKRGPCGRGDIDCGSRRSDSVGSFGKLPESIQWTDHHTLPVAKVRA